jgi:hypothetical protein
MKERKSNQCNDVSTEIVCILDRSGSMSSIRDDTIGSFNTFLKDQKELPGKATMSVMLFDDEYQMLYDGVNLECVEPLTTKTYVPGGTTALYDAIGIALNKAECRFKHGNRVLVAIITDGQENASKEYNKCQIMEFIKKCKNKYEWEFLYLSASPSAFSDSESIGIDRNRTYHFMPTSHGMRGMMATYGCSISSYRTSGHVKDFNN